MKGLLAIASGGIMAGILDLTYAIVVYSPRNPILIPQTIASGVLGPQSYQDGTNAAVLGVALHFFIAFSAATVYYLASLKIDALTRYPLWCGMAYGAEVYLVMHALVLPLSAVPKHPIPPVYVVTEFIEHWFFVGLPIAFSLRKRTLLHLAFGCSKRLGRTSL